MAEAVAGVTPTIPSPIWVMNMPPLDVMFFLHDRHQCYWYMGYQMIVARSAITDATKGGSHGSLDASPVRLFLFARDAFGMFDISKYHRSGKRIDGELSLEQINKGATNHGKFTSQSLA